jgi:hypothetical protein
VETVIMSDQPESTAGLADLKAKLQAAAEELRGARHIEPEAQRALADLVAELAEALGPEATCERTAQLAASSAHLVAALHEQHNAGLIAAARDRLEEAAARAEANAPVAAGLARQLVDLLAGIGV